MKAVRSVLRQILRWMLGNYVSRSPLFVLTVLVFEAAAVSINLELLRELDP